MQVVWESWRCADAFNIHELLSNHWLLYVAVRNIHWMVVGTRRNKAEKECSEIKQKEKYLQISFVGNRWGMKKHGPSSVDAVGRHGRRLNRRQRRGSHYGCRHMVCVRRHNRRLLTLNGNEARHGEWHKQHGIGSWIRCNLLNGRRCNWSELLGWRLCNGRNSRCWSCLNG